MHIVANNIRKILDNRGLKQKAIAEKAGYSEKQFSNLLCERKKMNPEDILKIAKVLEVTPNDLYGIK